MVLRCSVCDQVHDEELRRETAIRVALYGAVAFAVCPSCGLEVKKPFPEGYLESAQSFVAEREKDSAEADRKLSEENAERERLNAMKACVQTLLAESAWWQFGRVREALLAGCEASRIHRGQVELVSFRNFIRRLQTTLANHGLLQMSGFEHLDTKAIDFISRYLDAARDGVQGLQDSREVAEICGAFVEGRLETIRDTLQWFLVHFAPEA